MEVNVTVIMRRKKRTEEKKKGQKGIFWISYVCHVIHLSLSFLSSEIHVNKKAGTTKINQEEEEDDKKEEDAVDKDIEDLDIETRAIDKNDNEENFVKDIDAARNIIDIEEEVIDHRIENPERVMKTEILPIIEVKESSLISVQCDRKTMSANYNWKKLVFLHKYLHAKFHEDWL